MAAKKYPILFYYYLGVWINRKMKNSFVGIRPVEFKQIAKLVILLIAMEHFSSKH